MVLVGESLESGTIQYTSRDGTSINAFYSRPAVPGSYPGVIVTMEGMGLMEHHKDQLLHLHYMVKSLLQY